MTHVFLGALVGVLVAPLVSQLIAVAGSWIAKLEAH